ncbi:hypothetical protein FGE05_22240 [Pseudomonas sp. ICMP22404]|nr:hypothetical protein FGE05_22240 [Pseudomonas sp. ICMP22404]
MQVSEASTLWEQSLLAIAVSQSATILTGLPLSRASFAPTGMGCRSSVNPRTPPVHESHQP